MLDEMITAGQKMIEATTALREMFSEAEALADKPNAAAVPEATPGSAPEIKMYTILLDFSSKVKFATYLLLTVYRTVPLSSSP